MSYRHFERSREIFFADRGAMYTIVQERSLGCARDDEAGERMGSQGRRAVFLEEGILVSQPSPRGEGAPKGRIGHWRYEREWENASQVDDL